MGLKFENWLLVVDRELSQENAALPPHGNASVASTAVETAPLVTLSCAPDRKLLTGASRPVVVSVVLIEGVHAVRAWAMLKSEINGLNRSTWTFRFCSSAIRTASSIVKRRMTAGV